MICNTEKVLRPGLTGARNTLGSSGLAFTTEKGLLPGPGKKVTEVNLKMDFSMVMVQRCLEMVQRMLENFSMVRKMDTEF